MKITSFFKPLFFSAALVLLVSCDKDFNEIGSGIIGDDHFNLEKDDATTVVINNISTGPVQSNDLPINPLGIYNNPAFGRTRANFVTQLEMVTPNPTFETFDNAPVIDSVVLTVPYFSKLESTNSDGTHIYEELDSVYGPPSSRIKLGVFESTYFLRDIDHDSEGNQVEQRYYSDQNANFDTHPDSDRLNTASLATQNNQFFFSNAEIKEKVIKDNGDVKINRIAPEMRLMLDVNYFTAKILQAPAGSLQNNNVFKNYFRGLYFKAEQSGSDPGQLALLDFKKGKVTIYYRQDKQTCTTNSSTGVETCTIDPLKPKTFVLNMAGNTVSLLENENLPADYVSAISQPFSATGHSKIYLKGGQGSTAIIDFFGEDDPLDADSVPEELEVIKSNNWLINEASLTFTIDRAAVGDPLTAEPDRLYLYDVNNKRPIIDYYFDNSTGGSANYNKRVHSGIIVKEDVDEGRGIKYKVRLTNYLRTLIKNDSTAVRLGLSVTQNIGNVEMVKLRNNNALVKDYIPKGSAMLPLGTVLYGNVPAGSSDENKKLKLEIYYTKLD